MKYSSEYASCHSRKLETLTSPDVRRTRSGSGSPLVEMYPETVSSVMSSMDSLPSTTSWATERTALTMSWRPP